MDHDRKRGDGRTGSAHPYEALTPDVVLDAMDGVGLRGDGRLTTLNSYENRVYRAMLEDGGSVVLKFYRPGRWSDAQIAEEHAFALEIAQAEVPLVAPLAPRGQTLHHHAGFAFSVSPYRGGRRPDIDDPEVLEALGRYLARIHAVGERRPFAWRPALDAESFGEEPLAWLLASGMVPPEASGRWQALARQAVDRAAQALAAVPARALRLHGDCHPGNVLWTPAPDGSGQAHFVDLDDARRGPAVQDLWMLLGGDRAQRQRQLVCLLEGYESVRPFERRELLLIEPLRTLRLLHYAAWVARRWADPIFPANFPWFGSAAYWQGQADLMAEQLEAMDEAPLAA